MTVRLDVPVLEGSLVRLEPLSMRHAADLARAGEEDRSAYRYTLVPRADGIEAYLEARVAASDLVTEQRAFSRAPAPEGNEPGLHDPA